MVRVIVVDEHDRVVDSKERDELTDTDSTRASAVYLFSPEGKILLAQRSFNRKHAPGKWGPSAAGTVEEAESYEESAYKELAEEIGVATVRLTPTKKVYNPNGPVHAQYFEGTIPEDTPLTLQTEEVAAAHWFTLRELTELVQTQPDLFTYGTRVWITETKERREKEN